MLTIIKLKQEVWWLNSELGGMIKSACMLNSRADKLDEILSMEKSTNNTKGLGYTGESSSKNNVFIPAED